MKSVVTKRKTSEIEFCYSDEGSKHRKKAIYKDKDDGDYGLQSNCSRDY